MPIIGIIAEGETDQAVIRNILIGLGIDSADIRDLRPEYRKDEGDLAFEGGYKGGTLQGVKNDCLERIEFDIFFGVLDTFIIIQLDTAECEDSGIGILRPPNKKSNLSYGTELRQNAVNKIDEWLDNNYKDKLLYAITIEEMESWILTIYLNEGKDKNRDTMTSADPKKKLQDELRRKNINNKGCIDAKAFFDKQTVDFKKKKILDLCISRNKSLQEFTESVKDKLNLK
jgi:hypothetical protein